MADQVVELQEIAKTYALGPNYIHALKGVNLSIKKKEISSRLWVRLAQENLLFLIS